MSVKTLFKRIDEVDGKCATDEMALAWRSFWKQELPLRTHGSTRYLDLKPLTSSLPLKLQFLTQYGGTLVFCQEYQRLITALCSPDVRCSHFFFTGTPGSGLSRVHLVNLPLNLNTCSGKTMGLYVLWLEALSKGQPVLLQLADEIVYLYDKDGVYLCDKPRKLRTAEGRNFLRDFWLLIDVDTRDWCPDPGSWQMIPQRCVWVSSPTLYKLKSLKNIGGSGQSMDLWYVRTCTEEELQTMKLVILYLSATCEMAELG